MNAYFSQLARYNLWALRKLYTHVDALPEADYRRDAGLFFHSVHGTLSHLLVAEHHLWFVRFAEGRSPRLALNDELEAAALGHVFNHATHHRGQISAAITAMGYACPEIDWVWMLQAESRANQESPR